MEIKWNHDYDSVLGTVENFTNTFVSLLLPQTRQHPGVKQWTLRGQAVTQKEQQREEVLRAARCRPSNRLHLKYILSCECRKLPLLHSYVQAAPGPTYHFPRRGAWRSSTHACAAGSELREKQQLRWEESPANPWPGICSRSACVFSGT